MKKIIPFVVLALMACNQPKEAPKNITKLPDSVALDIVRPQVVKYIDSLKTRKDWSLLNFQIAYNNEYAEVKVNPNPLKYLRFDGQKDILTFNIQLANSRDRYIKYKGNAVIETGILIKVDTLGKPIAHTGWVTFYPDTYIEFKPGDGLYNYMLKN